ncbi:RNA 3'-terminal phosphate cyclase-like protein [Halotydeus destructor]|nr:RNA 3'-terminal phosphate cyclase-like protein [Halotydeus destructor]
MVNPIEFEGSNCLRQRLILSTLSGKAIIISKIRVSDEEPGLKENEISLFKLIEKLSNGTSIQIDETGTQVEYTPGLLIGGVIEHDCGLERSISYFLEFLFCVAPFCKNKPEITLTGVTNDSIDPSVDTLKHSVIPFLKKSLRIYDNADIELKVLGRGVKPNGGGRVLFRCPLRKNLKPINWTEPGKIKRIRGVAFATRTSPQIANRMVEISKGLLLQYLPDVYIHTDHMHGKSSGKSPGFGLCLYAETTEGAIYTGEAISNPSGSDLGPTVPEELAKQATYNLFEEIYRGGCVDSVAQGVAVLYMGLGDPDLSKLTLGPLSPYTIHMFRHMQKLLSLTFKLDVDKNEKEEATTRLVKDNSSLRRNRLYELEQNNHLDKGVKF